MSVIKAATCYRKGVGATAHMTLPKPVERLWWRRTREKSFVWNGFRPSRVLSVKMCLCGND